MGVCTAFGVSTRILDYSNLITSTTCEWWQKYFSRRQAHTQTCRSMHRRTHPQKQWGFCHKWSFRWV